MIHEMGKAPVDNGGFGSKKTAAVACRTVRKLLVKGGCKSSWRDRSKQIMCRVVLRDRVGLRRKECADCQR